MTDIFDNVDSSIIFSVVFIRAHIGNGKWISRPDSFIIVHLYYLNAASVTQRILYDIYEMDANLMVIQCVVCIPSIEERNRWISDAKSSPKIHTYTCEI